MEKSLLYQKINDKPGEVFPTHIIFKSLISFLYKKQKRQPKKTSVNKRYQKTIHRKGK